MHPRIHATFAVLTVFAGAPAALGQIGVFGPTVVNTEYRQDSLQAVPSAACTRRGKRRACTPCRSRRT